MGNVLVVLYAPDKAVGSTDPFAVILKNSVRCCESERKAAPIQKVETMYSFKKGF